MGEWQRVRLGKLLTESKVLSANPDPDKRITVRLHVNGVEKRPFAEEKSGATKYFVRRAGQFIYGKQNFQKGAFGVVPPELDEFESSLDLPAFDVRKDCLPEWLVYWFRNGHLYEHLSKIARGAGSQRISVEDFYQFEIALPDIATQTEIISGIKSFEQTKDELEKEKEYQLSLFKHLRQAVLKEAVTGKLTADWRRQHPVVKGDPQHDAAALLAQIKVEKERLVKAGKIRKEKIFKPICESECPYELPKEWNWCRLGEVLELLTDYHANGSYEILKKNVNLLNTENHAIMLRTTNFHDKSRLDYKYITSEAYNFLSKSKVFLGDVIMNKIADPGATFYVEDLGKPMSLAMNLFLLRFPRNYIASKYVYLFLKFDYEHIITFANGTATLTITKDAVCNLRFPLPPIAEQQAIVARVDSLMATIAALEAQVTERKEQAQQLMQAVLREAFAGGANG